MLLKKRFMDHVICSLPALNCGGEKTEGSNTNISTSFGVNFWSNEKIDVYITYPLTSLSIKSSLFDCIVFVYRKSLRALKYGPFSGTRNKLLPAIFLQNNLFFDPIF